MTIGDYIKGYVIDNYNFDIYQIDICLTKKNILDVINFHSIGSQIRFVNGKPYKIICEAYLKEGYTYFPSTLTKGNKPDILGSIIVTGIDEYGDSVPLTDDDIKTIEEFVSLRTYNKNGILQSIYTLEVDNPTGTNIQTNEQSEIPNLRRAL